MLAGIDVGTTGCKCTVYHESGTAVREAYEEYPSRTDTEGRELNPMQVWACVRKVMHRTARPGECWDAVGVSSFGEAVALLDENDMPVMNTLLYADSRGKEECRRLEEKAGRDYIQRVTGLNPHEQYSVPKLMWIQEHEPGLYEKARHIFLYGDYIVYMLTGEKRIDHSLASRTMAFDVEKKQWDGKIFQAAGIDPEKMSVPVETGTAAGRMKKALMDELGIRGKGIVAVGCHDQIAAACGAGVFSDGTAVNGSGTVECITPVFSGEKDRAAMMEGNYCRVPYLIPGTYVTYAYTLTGGALLKWYRDHLAAQEADRARACGQSPYEVFNRKLSQSPTGLLILPHFAGAATPYTDSESKGAILGLTLETEKETIYQALMEAVGFEMKLNMERLSRAGIRADRLYACGGGARSEGWLQIKTDILGIPICSLGDVQAGIMGCVMMAGVAGGIYRDLQEAAACCVKEGK